MPSSVPTCDTDGCDAECPGLGDGWEDIDGTLRCADDWDYWTRHGHWPDDDVEICIECKIDDGAVRHDCPESAAGIVLAEPDDACPYCGAEVSDGE